MLDGSDRNGDPSGRARLRYPRDRSGARGPGRPVRSAGPVRRTDPRPARRAADRPQFLLGRQPRGADADRLGASAGRSAEALLARHSRSTDAIHRPSAPPGAPSNMRTGGDDIAQALALLGVEPEWEPGAGRVTGFESCRLAELGRPRVDVTLRISGFFRDAFPRRSSCSTRRCARSARWTSREPTIRSHARMRRRGGLLAIRASSPERGPPPRRLPRLRLEARRLWRRPAGADRRARLADAPISPAPISPGAAMPMAARRRGAARASSRRLCRIERRLHNQDNREHDLLDQRRLLPVRGRLDRGGRAICRGARPWSSTTTTPARSAGRRAPSRRRSAAWCARASSIPKWIAGVMRHGYKGAFEIAATVDYLFAFAATTGAVKTIISILLRRLSRRRRSAPSWPDTIPPRLPRSRRASPRRSTRGLWSPRRNLSPPDRSSRLSTETP